VPARGLAFFGPRVTRANVKVIGLAVALIAAIAALVFRPHPAETTFTAADSRSHAARARVIKKAPPADVYVAGAVSKPGVYAIPGNARVIDALRLAGGVRADADLDSVNLAAHVSDGEKIAVETHEQRLARESRAAPRARKTAMPKAPRAIRGSAKRAFAATEPVDLNTAAAAEIARLPGIGIGIARRITDFRDLNGPFDSIDDLADIDGVTERTIDAITPFVVVH